MKQCNEILVFARYGVYRLDEFQNLKNKIMPPTSSFIVCTAELASSPIIGEKTFFRRLMKISYTPGKRPKYLTLLELKEQEDPYYSLCNKIDLN